MDISEIMAQLAQYNRLYEETAEIIDGLKDQIKAYMAENNLDTVASDEHKAIYKAVQSSRIDTAALKKDLPDVAARYTKTTASMRFTFA